MAIRISQDDAFRYPSYPLARRHGPAGYADYRSYRPWLRDEFTFRCVYCLIREQWGRVTGEFDLDHFRPQSRSHDEAVEYSNLLYACRACNVRKGAGLLPDPSMVLTAKNTKVYPDGAIDGLTDDAEKIIRVLCLNSRSWKRWRRTWMRVIELAEEHDQHLLQQLLGYPEDLPNLSVCRAPENRRPQGINDSYFARRSRGELPGMYLE